MNTNHRQQRINNLAPTSRVLTMRSCGEQHIRTSSLAMVAIALGLACLAGCAGEVPGSDAQSGECAARKPDSQELTTENTKCYPNEEYQASIVQILAHRDRYHGKEVQIEGYLRVQFEGTAIYLSKEDADYGITRNGFWVSLGKDASKYDRKYVLIEGTFDKNLLGHMSLWQGTITNVTRIVELTKHD